MSTFVHDVIPDDDDAELTPEWAYWDWYEDEFCPICGELYCTCDDWDDEHGGDYDDGE